MRSSNLLLGFLSLLPLSSCIFLNNGSFTTIPGPVATGASKAQFISSAFGLDASKIDFINSSSYEWWYFDVVSVDQKFSIVFIFFAAPNDSFPFSRAPDSDITNVFLSISTPQNESLVNGPVQATKADILAVGNGASGVWVGSGFAFSGSPDMTFYSITVDSPEIGMSGLITFESIVPAHYVCSPACGGQNMEFFPHLGWANAVPDAQAQVNLMVDGVAVQFTGLGYHDMNWADKAFFELIDSWYWGHGHVGPYSIVWVDAIDTQGNEHVSFYIASHGEIISNQCSGVSVRPTGKGDRFPPKAADGPPSGDLHIEADLGLVGRFVADVTTTVQLFDAEGVFFRFSGSLKGGIQGQETYTGAALYETFQLSS